MQANTLDRAAESQLFVTHQRDGTVHQRSDERADADAEHEREGCVAREHEHREHDGGQHGVQNHEPPRLLVQVAQRAA